MITINIKDLNDYNEEVEALAEEVFETENTIYNAIREIGDDERVKKFTLWYLAKLNTMQIEYGNSDAIEKAHMGGLMVDIKVNALWSGLCDLEELCNEVFEKYKQDIKLVEMLGEQTKMWFSKIDRMYEEIKLFYRYQKLTGTLNSVDWEVGFDED
ncbi:hypothetical protein [Bacillus sp. FSL E2-8887]|uniref:hypothetical protein n=1 Tax=Bacillus sp. FSL E2-8887 TaxID=2954599 RepID=UPI0030F711EB